MYSSRHCPQNLWSHLVRTGSFDGRKHIMQWRSSPGGLINCSSWPEGTERLFGLLLLPLKPTSSPGSSRFPIWRQQERCINATLRAGRVLMRLDYTIFFLLQRTTVHNKNGRALGPSALNFTKAVSEPFEFPAPNWLKNIGEVAGF